MRGAAYAVRVWFWSGAGNFLFTQLLFILFNMTSYVNFVMHIYLPNTVYFISQIPLADSSELVPLFSFIVASFCLSTNLLFYYLPYSYVYFFHTYVSLPQQCLTTWTIVVWLKLFKCSEIVCSLSNHYHLCTYIFLSVSLLIIVSCAISSLPHVMCWHFLFTFFVVNNMHIH